MSESVTANEVFVANFTRYSTEDLRDLAMFLRDFYRQSRRDNRAAPRGISVLLDHPWVVRVRYFSPQADQAVLYDRLVGAGCYVRGKGTSRDPDSISVVRPTPRYFSALSPLELLSTARGVMPTPMLAQLVGRMCYELEGRPGNPSNLVLYRGGLYQSAWAAVQAADLAVRFPSREITEAEISQASKLEEAANLYRSASLDSAHARRQVLASRRALAQIAHRLREDTEVDDRVRVRLSEHRIEAQEAMQRCLGGSDHEQSEQDPIQAENTKEESDAEADMYF